jgi:CIC family chloride channel protein
MSACLGAVVQAPVTALLIIFEMTHQFALVPGLMIAGLISQLLARKLSPESFYEAVLAQDGHKMDHVVPPRDLRSWQGLPISAIAQFEPVTTGTLQPAALTALAGRTPYHRFPVVMGDKLVGVVLRKEILATPSDEQSVPVHPVPCARPHESILQCQGRLIESVSGMIVVTDREKGIPLAVVTLHDLLRAQTALSDREGALG